MPTASSACRAKDLGTGKEQQITITASTNLSKEEVDRMVRDAEASAAADKAKREEAEIRNTASSLIYSTEKSLKEVGEKADATLKAEVEAALADLKKISENGTPAEVKAATEKLQQSSYKLAEELYKQTGAVGRRRVGQRQRRAPTARPAPTTARPAAARLRNDDVIDAEFKEAK